MTSAPGPPAPPEVQLHTIDLNCDLGEIEELWLSGVEPALLQHVSSVNIACGGHAGTPESMRRTMLAAADRGVCIGAHPGYPDREHFGRRELGWAPTEITLAVRAQLEQFAETVLRLGLRMAHIKPHGALYNRAAQEEEAAQAIAEAAAPWKSQVFLVGLAGSRMIGVCRAAGFRVLEEGFADRAYQPDGSLRPRSLPGALLPPAEAADQAVRLARSGRVQTICIHSDTPGAVEVAQRVSRRLRELHLELHGPC